MKYSVAHKYIPGGAHTYSKADDQFPENAPAFLDKGQGVYVWDNLNNKFLDWTMGLRSVTLGYGYEPVVEAVKKQLNLGTVFGRPSYIEVEVAQNIIDLIPSIEMVKFAKNGSTSNSAALRLARAYTGKKHIAYCKTHPFFSYDDWFIGTTVCNAGIPEEHYKYSKPFFYGDIKSLEEIIANHPNDVAAVIMEPISICEKNCGLVNRDFFCTKCECKSFAKNVELLCKKNGIVFILDEIITGFRFDLRGGQKLLDLDPDLTTFGKGIANGFSFSVLGGKKEIMQHGGIDQEGTDRVFLMSTTYGSENIGLAAANATINVYREKDVISHMWNIGETLIRKVNQISKEMGLQDFFGMYNFSCRPEFFTKNKSLENSLEFRTIFLQEMIKNGIICNYFVPSYSHTMEHVDITVEAIERSLSVYAKALEFGWEKYLCGSPIKPVFRKKN